MKDLTGLRFEKVELNGRFVKEFLGKDGATYTRVKLPFKASFITGNNTTVDLSNYSFIIPSSQATRDVYVSAGNVYYIYHLSICTEATYNVQRRKLRDDATKNITEDGVWLNPPSDFEVIHLQVSGADIVSAINKANNDYEEYKRLRNEQRAEAVEG